MENRFSTVVGRLQATGTAGDMAVTAEKMCIRDRVMPCLRAFFHTGHQRAGAVARNAKP